MKLAVGLIGIFLSLLVMLHGCTVAAGGEMLADQRIGEAGIVGIFVGLLMFFGGAFAFGLPAVSIVTFALGGLLGLGVSEDFPDMWHWGIVSFGLGVLAFFAWRLDRKAKVKTAPPPTIEAGR